MTKHSFQRQPRSYLIGIALIIFWSLITGIANIGIFYFFGIPLFGILLGIAFLWSADIDLRRKVLFTFAPIPIIFLTLFITLQLNKAESETFLISSERRGEIFVFYDEPCGEQPFYENGRRIYKIPGDGILITAFGENKGSLNRTFYLLKKDGTATELPHFSSHYFNSVKENRSYFHPTPVSELTMDSVGVFESYGGESGWISKNSIKYIVSDFHYFETDRQQKFFETKAFVNAAKSKLEKCREDFQRD